MFDSKLPNRYWIYAFNHSIFLHNVLPRSGSDISSYEKISLSAKNIDGLLPFGCKIFSYNYNNTQKLFTTNIGVFLSNDKTVKNAYVLTLNDNKVRRTSAFKGISTIFPFKDKKLEMNNEEPPTPVVKATELAKPEQAQISNTAAADDDESIATRIKNSRAVVVTGTNKLRGVTELGTKRSVDSEDILKRRKSDCGVSED
ncbi:hypothetical protein CANARDRAFT_9670 [[Candida] arabinofermentans NRRL YB-2248]|uniref:Uncharacterized protein n=1 Tax=[Candida] arabinofermentans NRRL YB-2248 TaxID=983967 RepID=A0A1E4SV98_9ASCO|nr:hypothetical protein CANARDRAFT_9670 [[Candida] arabinofermentans NRRL YB-2248]